MEKRCGRCGLRFGPLQCRISCRLRPCSCRAVISVARCRSYQQLSLRGWSRLRLSSSSYGVGRLKHPLVKRAEWMCALRLWWLYNVSVVVPGVVEAVCVEPHSYMVRLVDGRRFRHTRWAINLDYSSSSLSAPSPSLRFSLVSVGVLPNRAGLPVGSADSGPAQLLPAPLPCTPVPPLSGVADPSQITADSLVRSATPVRPSFRHDPVCLVPDNPVVAAEPASNVQPTPLFTRSGRQYSRWLRSV